MKWYLVITTTIGVLDMSALDVYYGTKKKAEEMADVARSLPDTVNVEVKRR